MRIGRSVLHELSASGLNADVEPREAKSEASKSAAARGSETKFLPYFSIIAEREQDNYEVSPSIFCGFTFFHTTEDGVSAFMDETNAVQLSFLAVRIVCKNLPQMSISTAKFIAGKSRGFSLQSLATGRVHQPLQKKGFTEVSDRVLECGADDKTVYLPVDDNKIRCEGSRQRSALDRTYRGGRENVR